MESQPGAPLHELWDGMKGSEKVEIVNQIVEIKKTLASTRFTKFGSLYYKRDLPKSDSTTPLFFDGNDNAIHSTEFGIGPTNHHRFFDFGRGGLDIDRGPCMYPLLVPTMKH
jgi:hypothetical protein